jgi:hypothetical protein
MIDIILEQFEQYCINEDYNKIEEYLKTYNNLANYIFYTKSIY